MYIFSEVVYLKRLITCQERSLNSEAYKKTDLRDELKAWSELCRLPCRWKNEEYCRRWATAVLSQRAAPLAKLSYASLTHWKQTHLVRKIWAMSLRTIIFHQACFTYCSDGTVHVKHSHRAILNWVNKGLWTGWWLTLKKILIRCGHLTQHSVKGISTYCYPTLNLRDFFWGPRFKWNWFHRGHLYLCFSPHNVLHLRDGDHLCQASNLWHDLKTPKGWNWIKIEYMLRANIRKALIQFEFHS